MNRMIFVNLPVQDLPTSIAFYSALGFTNNAHFSDETAACMVWSNEIHVMLLTHDKWRQFTKKPIAPGSTSEVMLALALDSIDAVNNMNMAAATSGGTADVNPKQELGFMYSCSFADPDGHIWEPFWMDPVAIPQS